MSIQKRFNHSGLLNTEPHNAIGGVLIAAPGVGKRVKITRLELNFAPLVPATAQGVMVGIHFGGQQLYGDAYVAMVSLSYVHGYFTGIYEGDQTPGWNRENEPLRWWGLHSSAGTGAGYLTILLDYFIESSSLTDGGAAGT